MLSDYWEAVLLTQRKNGAFTLKLKSGGDGTTRSDFTSKPFRTARGFLEAVAKASELSSTSSFSDGDVDSWLPAISVFSVQLASKLRDACAER